jgi:hypothetical protein
MLWFKYSHIILLFECTKVVSPPKVGGPGGPAMHLFNRLVLGADIQHMGGKLFYNALS